MEQNVASTPATTETAQSTEVGMQDMIPAGVNPAYAKKPAKEKKPAVEPEVKEQVKEPVKSQEQTEQEKKIETALKKLKVKGKDIEVDDAKYHEYAQKGAASTETWQEAAQMKREAEAFWKKLKENPREALADPNLGIDLKRIAEEIIWDDIQEERLTPEEKQAMKERSELEKYRQKEQEAKRIAEEQKQRELDDHFAADYDKKIAKAVLDSGLPKSTAVIKRMTDYILYDVKNGRERDFSEYIDVVREDISKDISEFFTDSDPDTIIKFLGDKNMKKIREADVKKFKTTTPKENHTFIPGKGMVQTKTKKLSGEDWMRQVRKEMMGMK